MTQPSPPEGDGGESTPDVPDEVGDGERLT